MDKTTSGFTIVELLIVIVVVAILAAISVVAYNGVQDRANNSIVMSDLEHAARQIQLFAVDNSGAYSVPTSSSGLKLTKPAYWTDNGNVFFCVNTATNVYILAARSKSGQQYKYISTEGLSAHGSAIYRQNACDLIGAGAYNSSNSPLAGYSSTAGLWSDWVGN